jgi:hypothetical protein
VSLFDRLAKSTYITVAPQQGESLNCGATRFRWWCHVGLPFTLPSRSCIHRKATVEGYEFDFSIHNSFDRLTVFPDSPRTWPSVYLIARSQPTPAPATGRRSARETLQSVACFVETAEYGTPDGPFAKAADKLKGCFRYLADHLGALQSSMPYLASWQVYPISQFDVGLVYHGTEHFCPRKGAWDHCQTGVTINLARQLHQPLCHVAFPEGSALTTPADLSNELLAEAQVSLFRGLFRSAVLNSYQAVESLANVVFKAGQISRYISDGMPQATAEAEAEKQRAQQRTRIKFLVHDGLLAACSRSLFIDDREKYEALCRLNQFRNQVAHAGKKPALSEAEAAHQLCCEVVQWLCGVGGFPVRQMLPPEEDLARGLVSLPSDINSVPGAAKAYLLWVLGMAPDQDLLQAPCQFGLRVGMKPPTPPVQ